MRLGRRVRRTRRGDYALSLPPDERDILRSLPAQLRALLENPDDPELRRLFPPAYADDPDSDADYRSLMQPDLLETHRQALDTLERTLDAERLSEEELGSWLTALNQLRLVLGTRLDVSEDQAPIPRGDPRAPGMALYGYLSWLQEQVVAALSSSL